MEEVRKEGNERGLGEEESASGKKEENVIDWPNE